MPFNKIFDSEGFASCMQPFFPFKLNATIAVAVSGGSDSMALILLANEWAKQRQYKLVAVTVDHGLRPESATEAKSVNAWLAAKGIEHHILTWEGKKPSANIQAEARKKRYALFFDWCHQHNAKYLMTAHHLDDQAETVLLRLARGSGVDGLSAIPSVSIRSGIRILRPLLGVRKEALQGYLQQQRQEWIEDPSNKSEAYARSALRKALETYADAPLISKRLVDTAHHMARVRNYLEIQTENAIEICVELYKEGYASLKCSRYTSLHEEIALRVLSNLLCAISGNETKPRFTPLETLYNRIKDGQEATLHGCKIAPGKKEDEYLIFREFSAIPSQVILSEGKPILWDNRFLITSISPTKQGQCIIMPLGAYSWAQLYTHSPKLKHSSIPKVVLKTLPMVVRVESGVEYYHILHMDEGKYVWELRYCPVKPLADTHFHY